MKHSLLKLAAAMALVALASCGADNRSNNQANGERTVENATLTKLSLTSTAFQDGQPVPRQYTCDGGDQTPALSWDEPPQGTKSFALVIDDPDAPALFGTGASSTFRRPFARSAAASGSGRK